ncbi:MAG: polymer-forming cytoskeletal protein [Clostridium sp.]|jgi:cytoskeletal protein CcmA (bactofilin family)|uniref:polymer-forming cytoskeletal protein n=1 Tax=Clostridium sp. TaxID=1506 RepID=UPI0025BD5C6D|nr:polymer-forming cytoskeletal protein [Clostridium sp.]MCH3963754.1 polymer-forming cytoskeletal protein [Clostridium sp.]MCI1714895.1 polymer-forming cytoskeletal protein [Clostridium sp.]MCI1798916.1 polymer-forming cytoskeletal protein [Clostridium sp.]MCI1813078.1 polymer-forming cytoskeletal protein [Clostridium sp.]MCI1869968.1 polymer-forming cytoskeletal protein [Clostridium sp.]
MEERKDLKISGSGSVGGGIYNEVKISGSGKINGDIDCKFLKVSGSGEIQGSVVVNGDIKFSGSGRIKGNIKSDRIDISGSMKVEGNIEKADEFKASGSSSVSEDAKIAKMKISGSSSVGGNLYAEEVEISGGINVKGDCESENFKAHGFIRIGGLLNAGQINMVLHGKSVAREIGGENINIRMSAFDESIVGKLLRSAFFYKKELVVESIEGDDIYLEGTTADIVRGKNITIGRECNINRVEYSGKINIINGGKVERQVRI